MPDFKKVYSFLQNAPEMSLANDMDTLPTMKKTHFLLVPCLFLLAACGVKPGHVSAPDGAEDSGFPHTYPDTRTDPAPASQGFGQ